MFDCRNAGLTSFLLRTIRCDIMTDMTSRRKTLKRDWFDNQPGAWVMVMLPAAAEEGALAVGHAVSAMATVIASFGNAVETACVMPINAAHASCAAADVTAARAAIRNMPDSSQIFDLHAWWPAGSLPVNGLIATVLFALTQYGSVLVVKTMIRERGKRSYVAASWVWHVALLLLAAVPAGRSPYLIAMTVLLLARAVALPVVTRRTILKPVVTGITEAFASFIAFGCIIAAI